MAKLRVAADFDGVLHSYTTPWVSEDVIPDPPVPGAIEWLNSMHRKFDICIHTTRASTAAGRTAIKAWLEKYGAEDPDSYVVTNLKIPAVLYIDDRGWRFTGSNFPTASEIRDTKRWGHDRNGELQESQIPYTYKPEEVSDSDNVK